jgi:hypothetical protein
VSEEGTPVLTYKTHNSPAREIYMTFWIWFPTNMNLGPDLNAHWWRWYGPGWSGAMIDAGGNIHPGYFQQCPVVYGKRTGEMWFECTGPLNLFTGTWHRYEALINQGDPNVANGSFKIWIDGAVVFNKTNVIILFEILILKPSYVLSQRNSFLTGSHS